MCYLRILNIEKNQTKNISRDILRQKVMLDSEFSLARGNVVVEELHMNMVLLFVDSVFFGPNLFQIEDCLLIQSLSQRRNRDSKVK